MKTSELTGAALDWAVAKCEPDDTLAIYFDEATGEPLCYDDWCPSTDWSQGGPIIEREGIAIDCIRWSGKIDGWIAVLPLFDEAKYADPSPTPLVAAMRCYVASRLGDTVEIPESLKG